MRSFNRRWKSFWWAVSGLVALGLGGAALIGAPALAQAADKDNATADAIHYADQLSLAFEHAADTIRPSVVTIKSVKHFKPAQHIQNGPDGLPPGLRNQLPFDDDFLRHFFNQMPQNQPPQEGLGSGVIVSKDGYILTNNHVVSGADEVTVTLDSGKDVPAKVVGTDPMSDLAVIRVQEDNLTPAKLGNSSELHTGQWVVAAGVPFGLRDTITAGIVSAKGRSNVRIAEYEDFIQTDAAINPGNSGGPLIDLHGRVVGINTAIASRGGGSNGVGFAIPINMAKTVMNSLIHNGQVVRGWLGVAIQPLDEALAKSFHYHSTDGALIGDVMAGGPAASAGLKPGDIVVKFGDQKISDVQELRSQVAATKPGTKVDMEVIRDGRTRTITVDVSQREATTVASNSANQENGAEIGVTVANLDSQAAQSLNLPSGAHGVVVTQVDPNGLAAMSGIEAGNLILDVQGTPVSDVNEFRAQLSKHDLKSGIRLHVQVGDSQRFVLLQKSGE